jgi:hypothetical protein
MHAAAQARVSIIAPVSAVFRRGASPDAQSAWPVVIDGTVVGGDSVAGFEVIELPVPLDAYNHDHEQARRSLRRIADLESPDRVPCHRGPLTGPNVRETLLRACA